MLTTYRLGTPTALPPLMIVHGLFGSARNWGAIAKRLSDSRQVITLDLRNHGDSPWLHSHSYPDLAADLAEAAAPFAPLDLVGHSMGGKASMLLALTQANLIRRLLIADIAPVAYSHTQLPLVAAMQALDLTTPMTRGQADAALTLSVPDPGTRAFLLQSLDLKATPPRWRLNLDVLAKDMPHITGWPETTGQFSGPTLFLSGALSSYVLPEHRPAIKSLFPAARFAKIPGAGHWLHADNPRAFEATIRAFLG